jgi:hypothetical protein
MVSLLLLFFEKAGRACPEPDLGYSYLDLRSKPQIRSPTETIPSSSSRVSTSPLDATTIKAKLTKHNNNSTVPRTIGGMLQQDGWRDKRTDEAASAASSRRESPSVIMESPAMIEPYEISDATASKNDWILNFRNSKAISTRSIVRRTAQRAWLLRLEPRWSCWAGSGLCGGRSGSSLRDWQRPF